MITFVDVRCRTSQVLCLDPPCSVSPTGLVVPIHLNVGAAAAAAAHANVLPVWPDVHIQPEDLCENTSDDDDDGDSDDGDDATSRRDQCIEFANEMDAVRKEWSKLVNSTTGAGAGAKEGKRKRTDAVDSGRANGT
jgi:hypothetical protein